MTTKAMILAAGRGERMRPLTDSIPKPLVEIKNKPLIVHHLERLAAAGITDVVVNHAHLGEQIEARLGDGSAMGVSIRYSPETEGGLETAGGIYHARKLLGAEPFIVVNGDVWTDYPFARLAAHDLAANRGHLVMIDNPPHKGRQHGDFYLSSSSRLTEQPPGRSLTYAGVAVFSWGLFEGFRGGSAPLLPLFKAAIEKKQLTAEHYGGDWEDVGTIERLEGLRNRVE